MEHQRRLAWQASSCLQPTGTSESGLTPHIATSPLYFAGCAGSQPGGGRGFRPWAGWRADAKRAKCKLCAPHSGSSPWSSMRSQARAGRSHLRASQYQRDDRCLHQRCVVRLHAQRGPRAPDLLPVSQRPKTHAANTTPLATGLAVLFCRHPTCHWPLTRWQWASVGNSSTKYRRPQSR